MYEFQVEKMICGGCANTVKRSVQGADSSAKVDIDLSSRTVRVDTEVDIDRVKATIIEAGYPVAGYTKL